MAALTSLAAIHAALFEARGGGRRHQIKGMAFAAGRRAATTLETRTGRYRLSVVEAPEGLAGGGQGFLLRVEVMFESALPTEDVVARFSLTMREVQVARLLAGGSTNERIASALVISPHTARRHTERVLAKLHVSSRAAVGAAMRGEPDVCIAPELGLPA